MFVFNIVSAKYELLAQLLSIHVLSFGISALLFMHISKTGLRVVTMTAVCLLFQAFVSSDRGGYVGIGN